MSNLESTPEIDVNFEPTDVLLAEPTDTYCRLWAEILTLRPIDRERILEFFKTQVSIEELVLTSHPYHRLRLFGILPASLLDSDSNLIDREVNIKREWSTSLFLKEILAISMNHELVEIDLDLDDYAFPLTGLSPSRLKGEVVLPRQTYRIAALSYLDGRKIYRLIPKNT